MEKINVHVTKHGNIPHYEWDGYLLEETPEFVAMICLPERIMIHHTKNKTFKLHNHSIEIFMKQEWFTVAASVENGKIVSYYCNIAKPSTFDGKTISFVDIDLDYVKRPYGQWEVVDEDEFIENQVRFGYSREMIRTAQQALTTLKEKVDQRLFPFNGYLEGLVKEGKHEI